MQCVFSGRLGLLDYDVVELSNLHRQVLHTELSQGQSKALSAAQAISRYHPLTHSQNPNKGEVNK